MNTYQILIHLISILDVYPNNYIFFYKHKHIPLAQFYFQTSSIIQKIFENSSKIQATIENKNTNNFTILFYFFEDWFENHFKKSS